MKVPLLQAREGCALLIDKVRSHAQDAQTLLDADRYPGAFLFVLLGYEELGKLIECIQKSAEAEKTGSPEIDLLDYHGGDARSSHTKKASLSTEYLQRGLKLAGWALRVLGTTDDSLGRLLDHLSAVGADYMRTRDALMFVDYENGTWTRGRPVDKESLEDDIGALGLVAGLVEVSLQTQPSFAGIVDSYTQAEQGFRLKFPEIAQELQAKYAEWLKTKQS